jgi:2-iminoacetate synthase
MQNVQILNKAKSGDLEELARNSKTLTEQYFGRTISLYAPLYIANYCDNYCTYCGFSAGLKLHRRKLTLVEIEQECKVLAATGIQNILILTGESREHSSVEYIREAVLLAKKYFPNIMLEIYPLETTEYQELYRAGADGVTLYQETYNRERYSELHPAGRKRDYDYRYQAPERIAQAGLRSISLGVLLGLADWQEDIKSLFEHLRYLEKKYPGVEYSLSFPRLQKINNQKYYEVSDENMVEIINTARLLFPRVGINLSTRERADFRDALIGLGITRMSAGSATAVGGYSDPQIKKQDQQFAVNDERSVAEIKTLLLNKGYDPVLTDWRSIPNE